MENISSVINTNTDNKKLDVKKVFICGGTGSGKTTLLRALLLLSKKKERFLNLSFFTNSTQVYFSNAASTVDL